MLLLDNYLSDVEMSKTPCWDLPSPVPGLHQATTSTQKSKYKGFPSPGSRQIQTGRINPPGMKIFILFLIYTSCQLCIEPTLYAVPRSPPEGHSSGPRSPALLPEPKPNYFPLSCQKKRRIFFKNK